MFRAELPYYLSTWGKIQTYKKIEFIRGSTFTVQKGILEKVVEVGG